MSGIFGNFPKTRPPLPEKIAEIYSVHYRENRDGATPATSISKRLESWLHKRVARDVVTDPSPKTTLEIGAGTLNQFEYEPELGPYDIVEPFTEFYEGSSLLGRVRNIYADISEISGGEEYDRVTSIATFEHICNLPEVIARAGLLLKNNGTLRVSIPSEGTLLWTAGWKLFTGIEFRLKWGLDYGALMRHEHVNTAREIEEVLRYFFKDVKGAVFGLTRSLSFYQFYECAGADTVACRAYLDDVGSSGGA